MVVRIDAAFFDRAQAHQQNRALQDLKDVLATTPAVNGMPAADRAAAGAYIDALAADCTAFDFNRPLSVQKYILIMLTQSRWAPNPLYWHYARRMIGLPDQAWRLESGVAAVYRNVVAQHFLGDAIKDYIASQEAD